MKKKVLIACDLEGVNFVVGEPYLGIGKDSSHWEVARHQAAKEINAAAEALFEAGVERVDLWDNHGGGGNISKEELDARIGLLDIDLQKGRLYFAPDYDCIFFFGYHTMEGTLGGVLAHTMNSKVNQFYKLNGRHIGEFDIDASIAAAHGVPALFFCGGDLTCRQVERTAPGIVTVVTKKEISRNEAEFRDNDELLAEIKAKAVEALDATPVLPVLTYPSLMEKSFKRVEDAAYYLKRKLALGMESEYLADDVLGRDAHTVVTKLYNLEDFLNALFNN